LPILIDALRSAATLLEQGRLNKLASNEIWNAYKLSRKGFVSNPDKVPGEIWETLWNIFTNPKTLNYGYLKILGQDMADADVPLQGWQRLAHIQAMFAEGDCDTAIKQWEECEMTMGRDNDTFKEYWEVGRRMYTRHNQLDKAVGAAEALIQSTKDASGFRSFLPIMNAVLHSKDKGREQKAWALYVRLKVGLGPQMEMKDYDAVASTFFGADLPDLALGVFRDMMLIGDASAGQHESTSIGNDPGVKSGLNLTNIGEKKLTWDDPRVLSKLPAKFNNKFFFGKWLKKLIGDGEYDASLKVFNLMHERGILPDARYVNGLIGAWLRTGKVNYHKLAEDTAWRMIQERLEYVKKQDTKTFLSYPLRPLVVEGKLDHKPIFRHPKATIETFSVLIEDYRRRQRHDRMKDLLGAFKQARIHPNTFFMNEMMMINSEVRQYYAWDTYTNLTQIQGVQPDFDTFGYLWFLTKKAVDPNINLTQYPKVAKEVQNTDVPRLMFAEMARWAHKLNRKERLPRELYNAIILCFSLAQDHPGTAVALRALQRHFNMFPNEDTVRTIVLQLARTGLNSNDSPARRQRVRFSVKKSPVVKERVVQVTKLLEGFKARRTDELLQQGVVFEELTGDERLEESLILMANLLRHVTQIRMEEDGDVAEIFEAAGRDMGVADCVP
jgi:pentatricopeptide repeat protein